MKRISFFLPVPTLLSGIHPAVLRECYTHRKSPSKHTPQVSSRVSEPKQQRKKLALTPHRSDTYHRLSLDQPTFGGSIIPSTWLGQNPSLISGAATEPHRE